MQLFVLNIEGSTLPKTKCPKEKKLKTWKPRNLLFPLFRDVARTSAVKIKEFIQVNKSDILHFLDHLHLKTTMTGEDTMENSGLITLIFSYLQTWHQIKKESGRYKQLVLTRHIQTLKEYITEKTDRRKVLIAMQFFFDKLKQQDGKSISFYYSFYFI